jgi:thiol:disulfide interchange protein DsbA
MKVKHVTTALIAVGLIIGVYLIFSLTNGRLKEGQSSFSSANVAVAAVPAAALEQAPDQSLPLAQIQASENKPQEKLEFVPGRDYREIPKPRRLFAEPADQVELVYIFWYACGTCRTLDPMIKQYEMSIPAGVVFRRIPALYAPNQFWMAHGQLFYTLEALGKETELHQAVFETVQRPTDPNHPKHESGGLTDLGSILEFAESKGISRQDFLKAWESKEVKDNIDRALSFTNNLNINAVPSMAIDGRYTFSITKKGPSFLLATAEYLINKEKEEAIK